MHETRTLKLLLDDLTVLCATFRDDKTGQQIETILDEIEESKEEERPIYLGVLENIEDMFIKGRKEAFFDHFDSGRVYGWSVF